MLFSLESKTVLITGACGSIGKAMTMSFLKQGANVIATDVREETLQEFATFLKSNLKKEIITIPCNLSVALEIEDLIKKIGDKLHILVNNAGINKDMLFGKMSEVDLNEVMKINLNATFLLTKNAISVMSSNRYGRIINISSVVGFTGNIGQVNYCASKAAIVGMSKAVALEVARKGITVNCIAPGAIQSPMLEKLSDANREKFINKIPMQRIGTPEDVANVCCFLASEEAAYITGQTIHVNGGMLMM